MLSLSPFFIDAFIPALSAYDVSDFRPSPKEHPVNHREPNYSLTENSQAAYLEVELPGVAKENVNLDLTGNAILLTAKRFNQNTKTDDVEPEHRENDTDENETKPSEKPNPSVVYQLKLRIGNRYDLEAIQASMEGDGLLKLTISARKPHTPRNIQIQ